MKRVTRQLDAFSRNLYLDLIHARGYECQEPEHENARWYHLLWFLVPVIGFMMFIVHIKDS